MSVRSKFRKAWDIVRMTWAVGINSGVTPAGHRCMVTVELTSICNLACPLCPTGTRTLSRKYKHIPMDIFDRVLELTAPFAEGFVLNMFGEPVLHPDLPQLMEKTRHLPTWLSTNLSYDIKFAHELAKWDHLHVICSVDTVNPQEYPEYRVGGDWEKVIRNLDILSRGKCRVYPQFLVDSGPENEQAYMAFARGHGIPEEDVIIKVKLDEFSLEPTDKPRPGVCHSGYTEIYFDCDGNLLPCCAHVREDLHIMHVSEIESSEALFRDPRGVAIRKALGRDKNRFASCGRCEGLNYWHKYLPRHLESARALLPWNRRKNGARRLSFFE